MTAWLCESSLNIHYLIDEGQDGEKLLYKQEK